MAKKPKKKLKKVLCTKCGLIETYQKDGICRCCRLEFPADDVKWLENFIKEGKYA